MKGLAGRARARRWTAQGRAPRLNRGRARGWALAAAAVLVAVVLAFPGIVPNAVGGAGSLTETFLPWLGLAVVALLIAALVRRSAVATLSLVVPALVWAAIFGERLLPPDSGLPDSGSADAGTVGRELTVVQHNLADDNPDPAGTARALAGAGADLVAVEELTREALPIYQAALSPALPHHAVVGTVGLWSRYPLADSRPVPIRPAGVGGDWNRGLRSTARTPYGEVAVYVAHLPSVRLRLPDGFGTGRRDESATLLGAAIAAERLSRVVVAGDFNATLNDRGLTPLTSRVKGAEERFGFSWPAAFPLARIDHVLARGAVPVATWTLSPTGSDHLPVAARIRF